MSERQQPSEDSFYQPTDVDVLRMENELLAFEVSFLRSRLAGTGRPPFGPASPAGLPNQVSQPEEAEQDLVLLLRRLFGTPVGPVLRRRKSFKILEERYLNPARGALQDPQARRQQAEQDLMLLLRRLGDSPLGPVFRRYKAFNTLERRYL